MLGAKSLWNRTIGSDPFYIILHNHACWYPGDTRSQGINRHHVYPLLLDYFVTHYCLKRLLHVLNLIYRKERNTVFADFECQGQTKRNRISDCFHIVVNFCDFNEPLIGCFQLVSPGGNTTFDVVFLARQEGYVENTLYIHTSQGSFKYQVCTVWNVDSTFLEKKGNSEFWYTDVIVLKSCDFRL